MASKQELKFWATATATGLAISYLFLRSLGVGETEPTKSSKKNDQPSPTLESNSLDQVGSTDSSNLKDSLLANPQQEPNVLGYTNCEVIEKGDSLSQLWIEEFGSEPGYYLAVSNQGNIRRQGPIDNLESFSDWPGDPQHPVEPGERLCRLPLYEPPLPLAPTPSSPTKSESQKERTSDPQPLSSEKYALTLMVGGYSIPLGFRNDGNNQGLHPGYENVASGAVDSELNQRLNSVAVGSTLLAIAPDGNHRITIETICESHAAEGIIARITRENTIYYNCGTTDFTNLNAIINNPELIPNYDPQAKYYYFYRFRFGAWEIVIGKEEAMPASQLPEIFINPANVPPNPAKPNYPGIPTSIMLENGPQQVIIWGDDSEETVLNIPESDTTTFLYQPAYEHEGVLWLAGHSTTEFGQNVTHLANLFINGEKKEFSAIIENQEYRYHIDDILFLELTDPTHPTTSFYILTNDTNRQLSPSEAYRLIIARLKEIGTGSLMLQTCFRSHGSDTGGRLMVFGRLIDPVAQR